MEPRNIIDLLGGPTVVARSIGAPVTTVHAWKTSGRIPRWRRAAIAGLARAEGVALPDDFMLVDAHAGRNTDTHPAQSCGSEVNPAPVKVEDQQ